jgi:hypothetical protein
MRCVFEFVRSSSLICSSQVWQVIVDTRQRADVHGCVGALVSSDLVVRGDRYARRARAYVTNSEACEVSCLPDAVFQLIPGAYNRLSLNLVSKVAGYRFEIYKYHGKDSVNLKIEFN